MANAGPNTNGSQFVSCSQLHVPIPDICASSSHWRDAFLIYSETDSSRLEPVFVSSLSFLPFPILVQFMTLAPTPFLDRKHTIFGRVKEGIKVVQRLGLVSTDAQDRPKEDVKIIQAQALSE